MFVEKSKAFILNNKNRDETFQRNFFRTLSLLDCSVETSTIWSEAFSEIKKTSKEYNLLVLDPTVRGFDSQKLNSLLTSLDPTCRPRIIIFSGGPTDDLSLLEFQLNSCAKIQENHSAYEMAFILNRIMHPEKLNRRENPRILVHSKIEYECYVDEIPKHGRVLNLSVGGLYLQSQTPEAPRKLLELKLVLSDGKEPIECTGRVVFQHIAQPSTEDLYPSGMGVRFLGINDVDRCRIGEFVHPRLLRIDRVGLP